MKKVEIKEPNQTNSSGFNELTNETYELSDEISQSSKYYFLKINSIKIKCVNIFNFFKQFLQKRNFQYPNISTLILNIFGFILYFFSLIGCHKGAENLCVTDFFVQFYILAFLLIIDCIIVSITLTLIAWKKIKKYHLLYLIIGYF